jgi:hypothetical protein
MQPDKLKQLGTILVIAIMLYACGSFIFAKPIDLKGTTLIKGHYMGLKQIITKGDVSYNLYVQESTDYFTVAADNSECFYAGLLDKDIKIGEPIQLNLQKSTFRKPMIVRVLANNTDYFSLNCANEEIEIERIKMPIIIFIVSLLIIGLIYKKEFKLRFK